MCVMILCVSVCHCDGVCSGVCGAVCGGAVFDAVCDGMCDGMCGALCEAVFSLFMLSWPHTSHYRRSGFDYEYLLNAKCDFL